jgi:hypothetical protein
MKLKNILDETVKMSYDSGKWMKFTLSNSTTFPEIENFIAKEVKSSLQKSSEFTKKITAFDLEVTKIDSNIKIIIKPKDGNKVSTGTFPASVVLKYLKIPNALASLLLSNYK